MLKGDIARTLAEVPTLLALVREAKPRPPSARDSLGARLEATAARHPAYTAVIFEGRQLSWRELNALTNRYAHSLRRLGVERGHTVSVMLENRIEFLSAVLALNKLGATAALLNTNLTGGPLAHCMAITDSRVCIVGEERLENVADVRQDPKLAGMGLYLYVRDRGETACPDWAFDLEEEAEDEDTANPPDTAASTLGEVALNIFTSGTTGLPKAAVMTNRRYLLAAGLASRAALQCKAGDCIYVCLPLYHGTAFFLGVGSAICTGAGLFLRRKFSATNFLSEVREHGATHFIYIGELCRYLLNTPERPDDRINSLTTMMGNGLRPDVWMKFKQRFGIQRIAEFYGSSEGNVAFVNLLNKDLTVGTTTLPVALVKYDVDADEMVRDADGHCVRVEPGEPGLLLGKITKMTQFEGYTTAADTEKKILHDVFRKGDAWFNTGDLMKTVDVGFALGLSHYQFVDRVGDTFRWKSENVSTNEVGEIINEHPQVSFCNVYGVPVPGADGRAGMAALVLAEGVKALDLKGFSRHVNDKLPPYARPVFLRIQRDLDTTGTFKLLKGDLRKQAYDLKQVTDPLYVMKPGSSVYEPLDADFAKLIAAGKAGY